MWRLRALDALLRTHWPDCPVRSVNSLAGRTARHLTPRPLPIHSFATPSTCASASPRGTSSAHDQPCAPRVEKSEGSGRDGEPEPPSGCASEGQSR